MYYKLINNDIVIDVLRKLQYVRYLPKSKRWIATDPQSAHGVIGSNQNSIFHIQGTSCPCAEQLEHVTIKEISEEEYNRFADEIALRAKEKEELTNRINSLEEALNKQTSLLEAVLAKLS